jgi:glycosyltransferase involved in cell wall biosynthesis
MQLYARELLIGWLESFPSDNVIVFGPQWLRQDIVAAGGNIFRYVTWPNKLFFLRIIGQLVVVPILFLVNRDTRLLALNAVASPIVPRRRVTVVNHDWRHLRNPEEFSRAQRIYRRLWSSTCRRAHTVIAVSSKTLRESQSILGRSDVHLVPHGDTHSSRWKLADQPRQTKGLNVVTFGHQSNKRPWLVVEAFLAALDQHPQLHGARLTVLGLDPSQLSEDHADLFLGHRDKLELPGFVENTEYQRYISGANLVVLASSDEGFGFPAVEARYFGIPCLVADDGGLSEIHGASVTSAPPEIAGFSKAMATLLLGVGTPVSRARSLRPWADVVRETRALVLY